MMNRKIMKFFIGIAFVIVAILFLNLGFWTRDYREKQLTEYISMLEFLHTETFKQVFYLMGFASEISDEERAFCKYRIIENQIMVLAYRESRLNTTTSVLWTNSYLESMDLLKKSGALSDFYKEFLPTPLKEFGNPSNPPVVEISSFIDVSNPHEK